MVAALTHSQEAFAGPAGRLDKVVAEVLVVNSASDAVLGRCGFRQETLLRRGTFEHGVSWKLAVDALFVGVVRSRWSTPHQAGQMSRSAGHRLNRQTGLSYRIEKQKIRSKSGA